MHAQSWFLGVSLLASLQSVLALNHTEAATSSHQSLKRQTTCAAGLHVVGIRGNSQRDPQPYGQMQPAIMGIKQKIAGSDDYPIVYPNSDGDGYSHSPIGTQALLDHLAEYVQDCPDTPILIWGYSRGGIIVMDGICGLNTTYQNNIIGVITYGEESRAENMPYNLGSCKSYGIFERTNTAPCLPWTNYIRSYCVNGDNLCCVGTGDENVHGKYCARFNKHVFPWITKQYKAFRAAQ